MKSIRNFRQFVSALTHTYKQWRKREKHRIETQFLKLEMAAARGDRERFLRLADDLPRRHFHDLYCRLDERIDPWDNLRRDENGEALNDLLWARDQISIRLSPLEG